MNKSNFNIEKAIEYMKGYIGTYDQQYKWEMYSFDTYFNDILYGIGVSINKDYETVFGFMKFKRDLLEWLKIDLQDCIQKEGLDEE